jgi:hypothetical protein
MTLTLLSPAFADGDPIPQKYARTHDNLFPPLKWNGVPDATQSLALVVEKTLMRQAGSFDIAGYSTFGRPGMGYPKVLILFRDQHHVFQKTTLAMRVMMDRNRPKVTAFTITTFVWPLFVSQAYPCPAQPAPS